MKIEPLTREKAVASVDTGSCIACGSKTSRFAAKPDRWYVKCGTCGSVQLDPVPTEEELAKLYSSDYAQAGHQLESEVLWKIRAAPDCFSIDLIRKNGVDDLVVEIGPGHGNFLERLRQQSIRAIGVEPSDEYVALLKRRGFEVEQGFVDDMSRQSLQAGCVYLSHVFEHLRDPAAALTAMKSALRPGGRIVMYQPTAYLGPYLGRLQQVLTSSQYMSDLGGWLQSPYHILLISPHGMDALCRKVGLRLLEVHATPTESVDGVRRVAGMVMNIVNRVGLRMTRRWPLVQCHHFVIGLSD